MPDHDDPQILINPIDWRRIGRRLGAARRQLGRLETKLGTLASDAQLRVTLTDLGNDLADALATWHEVHSDPDQDEAAVGQV